MVWQMTLCTLPMMEVSAISAMSALCVWQHDAAAGGNMFTLMVTMSLSSVWAITMIVEFANEGYRLILDNFILNSKVLSIVSGIPRRKGLDLFSIFVYLGVFWFLFAHQNQKV